MIRSLTADDSDIYFALRGAIARSPIARFYSDSVEREAALDTQGKRDWCTENDAHCIRGTFENGKLLTITMLTRQGGPGSPLVELEAAYVDARLRGTGKGRAAYEDAVEKAKQTGYRYMIGFVRDEFTTAHHLCSSLGFVHAYTIHAEKWADGSTCDTKAYVMALDGDTPEERRINTLKHMDEILLHAQACIHAPKLEPQQQALRHLEQTLEVLRVPSARHGEPLSVSAQRPGGEQIRESTKARHG